MGRITGKACKLCRREGVKLFLKGTRCDTVKCGLSRREYPPGAHSWRRRSPSEYNVRLREKQKLKRFFGLGERQFRKIFEIAEHQKGDTGQNLLLLLERRLDNVVFLLGFALSRRSARQLVAHGNITLNGRKVDIPAALVRPDDVIKPKATERAAKLVKEAIEARQGAEVPAWLERNQDTLEGKVLRLPSPEEVSLPVEVQLVVELCSR